MIFSKKIILWFLTLGVGFFGFYFLDLSLSVGDNFLNLLIFTLWFLVIFGILFSFLALFLNFKEFLISALILAALPLLIFEKNYYFLGGSALYFLCLFFSGRKISREKELRLKFKYWDIVSRPLGLFLTGFSLILAIILAFSPQLSSFSFEFPRPIFDFCFKIMEKPLAWYFPGFHPEITVEQFLDLGFEKVIEAQRTELSGLPQEIVNQKIRELKASYLQQQREKLSQLFKTKIVGKEKLKDLAYLAINQAWPRLMSPYRSFIPPLLIFFGFFAIKPLTVPLKWISLIFGSILIKILILLKILKIKIEETEKEVLSL